MLRESNSPPARARKLLRSYSLPAQAGACTLKALPFTAGNVQGRLCFLYSFLAWLNTAAGNAAGWGERILGSLGAVLGKPGPHQRGFISCGGKLTGRDAGEVVGRRAIRFLFGSVVSDVAVDRLAAFCLLCRQLPLFSVQIFVSTMLSVVISRVSPCSRWKGADWYS